MYLYVGGRASTCLRMRWSAPPKCISYMGAKRFEMLLIPLHVKSKIRRDLLPTWGMTATTESHMLWGYVTSFKGKTATCPACTFLARFALTNSASLLSEA